MIEAITQWFAQQGFPQQLVIAYSGGRDSHVLLHAFWLLRQQYPLHLRAVHIHHGLHPHASLWAQHCQEVCQRYGITLEVIPMSLCIGRGVSVEAVARAARYKAFAQHLAVDELLLTAHTLDDQAETVLLQLMRGAGPKGLAGIAPLKGLGKGKLGRPLLNVAKTDIADFAVMHNLQWVEDPSNNEKRFRRNFLRHDIFPALQKVVPGLAHCLARTAKHCASSQALLDEYVMQDLQMLMGKEPKTLNLAQLKRFSPLKQGYILRQWLMFHQVPCPATKKLQDLLHQMLTAKQDANPCVSWGNSQITRYQDLLYLEVEKKTVNQAQWIKWYLADMALQPLAGGNWRARLVKGGGIDAGKIHNTLEVRFRQGGEVCQLAGKNFSRPLKKIFQELKIPYWQRANIPLFYQQETLVGVGEHFVCEGWQVKDPLQSGWVIEKVC